MSPRQHTHKRRRDRPSGLPAAVKVGDSVVVKPGVRDPDFDVDVGGWQGHVLAEPDADGLILIGPSEVADARMTMYNADGSRGEMCGNGIRCVAKYVYEHDIAHKDELVIETDAGPKRLQVKVADGRVESVCVGMGKPALDRPDIPMTGPAGRVIDEALDVAGRTLRVTANSIAIPFRSSP